MTVVLMTSREKMAHDLGGMLYEIGGSTLVRLPTLRAMYG
jgi:hypothetical protein